MDDLLHFLRHEIAMDGDDGTPVDRLDSFVQAYYARQASELQGQDGLPIASTSKIVSQNLDEAFMEFVWRQLILLPELKVAFLRKLDQSNAAAGGPAGPGNAQGTPQPDEADGATARDVEMGGTRNGSPEMDQGAYNLKNKAKIKAERAGAGGKKTARDARLMHDAWEFCELDPSEVEGVARAALVEKYGQERLRVAASPEACYVALTGSAERRSRLTHLTYQILQAIARGRENGKTVVDLGKEFDHDQKSLFHFVKSLVEMNFIVKMKISDVRSQTNRCIHRHYLETSEHWATYQTRDVGSTDVRGADDDDEEDAATAPSQMTILTVAHLNGNEPLIRARIIAALKREKDHVIPHIDMVFKIGFQYRPAQHDRRKLNRILTSMVEQGLIEKVGVRQAGARGDLSCIRLVDKAEDGDEHGVQPHAAEEEEQPIERPNLLMTIPVEKQLVDLLIEAGPQGLTIRDMKAALGELNSRTLEAILGRYEKAAHPPHLCDYAIQSVLETVGREKRLRWFSLAGYHERCRLDGLADLPGMKQFTHPEEAGSFSRLESSGFYETPQAFREFASGWNTNIAGMLYGKPGRKQGAGATASGKRGPDKKPRAPRTYKARAPSEQKATIGRPKGTTKAAKLQAQLDAGEITQEQYEELLNKPGKPRGKYAEGKKKIAALEEKLQSGEITQEAYDEEMAKIPKPKGPKKTMREEKLEELEARLKSGELTQEGHDAEVAKLPKPKAKGPRKSKVATPAVAERDPSTPAADGDAEASMAVDAEGSAGPSNPRPPKLHPRSKAFKLEQDLANGVVTPEEYEELKKKLPKPKPKAAASEAAGKKRKASEMLAEEESHAAQNGTPGPSAPASEAGGEPAPKKRYPNSKEGKLRKQFDDGGIEQEEYNRRAAELKAARGFGGAAARAKLAQLENEFAGGSMSQLEYQEKKSHLMKLGRYQTAKDRLADLEKKREKGEIDQQEYEKQKEEIESIKPGPKGPRGARSESVAEGPSSRAGSVAVSGDDTADPQPNAGSLATAQAGTATSAKKAKKKNPIGPDGKPVRGRARKYPEGTNSAQRRKLLEERRAMGLEPPSKKDAARSADNGSAQPDNTPDETMAEIEEQSDADISVPAEQSEAGTFAPDVTMDEGVALSFDNTARQNESMALEDGEDPYVDILGKLAEVAGAATPASGPGSPSSTHGSASASTSKKSAPLKRVRVYEKLAPGEKRPRGRPRKYARVGPPTIPKIKYGTYPDLVIYPPVATDDTDSADSEGQARKGVKEEAPEVLSKRTRSGREPAPEAARKEARPASKAVQRARSPPQEAQERQPETPVDAARETVSLAVGTDLLLPEMPAPEANQADEDAGMRDFQLPAMPDPSAPAVEEGEKGENSHSLNSATNDTLQLAPNITILPSQPLAAGEPQAKQVRLRDNYSMHLYSLEFASALRDSGGLAIEGHAFQKTWQLYKQKKDQLPEPPKPLDKRTASTVLNILFDNGTIRRSVLQVLGRSGKLVQFPVMYLSEIALGGPQMRAFAKQLQDQQRQEIAPKQKWLDGRKILEVDGLVSSGRSARVKQEERLDLGDNPRAYFQQEWRAVAQLYGWQYGAYARARTLHQFLVASITDENDSLFISSSRPEARIFSPRLIKEDIPLSIYLSIVAVWRDTAELDAFLASNDPAKVLVSQLPTALQTSVRPPTESMHRDRTFPLLNILVMLRLLIPLDISAEKTDIVAFSGHSREPRYFKPRKLRGAKYLMLGNAAPVYDLGKRDPPKQVLLGEMPIHTEEQASQYWETLRSVVIGTTAQYQLASPTADHPDSLAMPPATKQSLRAVGHWYSQYILLRAQKTYIKRVLAEQGVLETIGSDDAIKKLAYDVCGKEGEVRQYAISVAAQQRRVQAARAKESRQVRSGIASKGRPPIESGTEASEASEIDDDTGPRRRAKRKKVKQAHPHRPATAIGAGTEDSAEQNRAQAVSVADVLARKARPADPERLKLWEDIYTRFVAEHSDSAISAEQFDFLKSWFLSPGGISVPALQEHLETMAEDSSAVLPTPSTSTNASKAKGRKKKGDGETSARAVDPESVPDVSFGMPEGLHDKRMTDGVLPVARADGPKRTVTTGWTEEEDEQLRDFYVIIQARANELGQKFSTDPLRKYYPGVPAKTILDRLRRLAASADNAPYLDELQEAWKDLWLEARQTGRLTDENWASVNGCDLGQHRSYLCAKLNKQAIRFQAMAPKGVVAAASKDLPGNPEDLLETVEITARHPLSERDTSYAFDYLYSTAYTATIKLNDFRYTAFTVSNALIERKPEHLSSTDRVKSFAAKFDYRNALPETTRNAAQAFEKTLVQEGEIEWPNVVEDGDMLALTQLFSRDLLHMKIDAASTKDSRPYTDYRTRKIDDENMENDLVVSLKNTYLSLKSPVFA